MHTTRVACMQQYRKQSHNLRLALQPCATSMVSTNDSSLMHGACVHMLCIYLWRVRGLEGERHLGESWRRSENPVAVIGGGDGGGCCWLLIWVVGCGINGDIWSWRTKVSPFKQLLTGSVFSSIWCGEEGGNRLSYRTLLRWYQNQREGFLHINTKHVFVSLLSTVCTEHLFCWCPWDCLNRWESKHSQTVSLCPYWTTSGWLIELTGFDQHLCDRSWLYLWTWKLWPGSKSKLLLEPTPLAMTRWLQIHEYQYYIVKPQWEINSDLQPRVLSQIPRNFSSTYRLTDSRFHIVQSSIALQPESTGIVHQNFVQPFDDLNSVKRIGVL